MHHLLPVLYFCFWNFINLLLDKLHCVSWIWLLISTSKHYDLSSRVNVKNWKKKGKAEKLIYVTDHQKVQQIENSAFGSNKKGRLAWKTLKEYIDSILNDFATLHQSTILFLALEKAYFLLFGNTVFCLYKNNAFLLEYRKKAEVEIFKRLWTLAHPKKLREEWDIILKTERLCKNLLSCVF